MFFDLIPNLLASLLSTLFPIFMSYKALHSTDPAQLAPWLMYWSTFALVSLADAWISPVASWVVPFYAWLRLGLLVWLVLPQTQGARWLYQARLHPFLARHERRLDRWLAEAVRRARAAGAAYVEDLIAWVKKVAFGIQPEARRAGGAPPAAASAESYVSGLLTRFNLPGAREGQAPTASSGGDIYGLLGAALGTFGRGGGGSSGGVGTAASRDAQIEALSRSGTLIPQDIQGAAARASFVGQQRERLRVLLGALDREAGELDAAQQHGDAAHRSRSEASFERIDREEAKTGESGGGGWLGWAAGQAMGAGQGKPGGKGGKEDGLAYGQSSGVEPR